MKKETLEWLDKTAERNNVTKEEVLKYVKSLSSTSRTIHHLRLA